MIVKRKPGVLYEYDMYVDGQLNKEKHSSFDNLFINLPEKEKYDGRLEHFNMFQVIKLQNKASSNFKYSVITKALNQSNIVQMVDHDSFVSIMTAKSLFKCQ